MCLYGNPPFYPPPRTHALPHPCPQVRRERGSMVTIPEAVREGLSEDAELDIEAAGEQGGAWVCWLGWAGGGGGAQRSDGQMLSCAPHPHPTHPTPPPSMSDAQVMWRPRMLVRC
jgi:hypothetical protein